MMELLGVICPDCRTMVEDIIAEDAYDSLLSADPPLRTLSPVQPTTLHPCGHEVTTLWTDMNGINKLEMKSGKVWERPPSAQSEALLRAYQDGYKVGVEHEANKRRSESAAAMERIRALQQELEDARGIAEYWQAEAAQHERNLLVLKAGWDWVLSAVQAANGAMEAASAYEAQRSPSGVGPPKPSQRPAGADLGRSGGK